ncbi:MAG: hypothetical protein OEY09_11010 [Gammaproteobacteria bacterium]|nr:hypothetical protein [Gammaproteobacteria bacterium]
MKIIFFIIGVLAFANAWAEHEVDHRYNVQGYILGSNEQGISSQDVLVYDGDKLVGQSKTDSAGYYSIHLHLHNEDRGRKLKLLSGSNQAEIRVTFDADNLTTLREHKANFVDGQFIEGSLNRFRIPPWVYPLIGLLLLVFIAVKLEKRRKKKLRESKFEHAGNPPSGSQKKKKKKRKKS